MAESVKIFVVGEGVEVPVSVHRTYTIRDLKNEIEHETGLGKLETCICFEGKTIDNDEDALLVNIGIVENDVLTIEMSDRELARLELLEHCSIDIHKMIESDTETHETIQRVLGSDNEIETIKRLTAAGIDHDKHLTLHSAVKKGRHEALIALLELNANPNVLNVYKETPLIVSCQVGDAEAASILLENGADISCVNVKGWDALMEAAAGDRIQIAKMLLEASANVNKVRGGYRPISLAAKRGSVGMVSLLIEFGSNINMTAFVDSHPLLLAAAEGHLDVVECLLNNNANINVSDSLNWTPLTHATWSGHVDVIRHLLANNADLAVVTSANESLLTLARRAQQMEALNLITAAVQERTQL